MRLLRILTATTLALVLTLSARAQTTVTPKPPQVLYTATVKDPEAEVKSGPSTEAKLYPTNRLRQGDTVEVVKEREDGWLEIKPPKDSFSWVNQRFLKRLNDTTWLVMTHDEAPVEVLYGSRVTDANVKPSVQSATLKRGTQVVSVWKEKTADDGIWLPIVPPPSEVRYIRAASVMKNNQTTAAAPAPVPATPTSFQSSNSYTNPAPAPAPAPTANANVHPKWIAAEAAVREGKPGEAERLYHELHQEVCNTNHDLAMQCLNRIQYLKDGNRVSVPSGYSPNRPSESRYGNGDNRLQPIPASPPASPIRGTTAGVVGLFPVQSQQNYMQPSGVGTLRTAGRGVDNMRTYVLEPQQQGGYRLYVTAQPGLDLAPYVNQTVELFGVIVYRGDLRAYYMTAAQVTPK